MSKKRIITIVNIVCSVLMIVSIFLPIVEQKTLFASSVNISKYFIVFVSLLAIVVNLIDKKVEYGLIGSGYVLFYLLDIANGIYLKMDYGFYIMFVAALLLMILTIVYGFMKDEKPEQQKQNVHSQFRSNGRVMNGYPNRNTQGNMQMPYPNQMMYRNGQTYNNNYRR